jgi:hypothetical protein
MGTIVGTGLFILFFLMILGLFLKFYLESNHVIDRSVKRTGATSYRAYKREANKRWRQKQKLERKKRAKARQSE